MRYGFLDWSGDVGFNFKASGTSRYIAFVLVSTDDRGRLRRALLEFRERRGLRRSYEFHYTGMGHSLREAFFARLCEEDLVGSFIAVGLAVEKERLPVNFARMREPDILAYFIAECVQRSARELHGMLLLLDGNPKQRDLVRDTIRAELSRRGHRLKSVRTYPSHKEDSLQLADMLAGAFVHSIQANQANRPDAHPPRHRYDHFRRLRNWRVQNGKPTATNEGEDANSIPALYLGLFPYGYPGA